VAKFSNSKVWFKVPDGNSPIFGNPNFHTTQFRMGGRKPACQKSFRPVVSIQYWLVTDGRTDGRTQDDSIYRASTASHGKKRFLTAKTSRTLLLSVHRDRTDFSVSTTTSFICRELHFCSNNNAAFIPLSIYYRCPTHVHNVCTLIAIRSH